MNASVSLRPVALVGCVVVSLGLLASGASAHPVRVGQGPVGGLFDLVIGAIFADEIARHEAAHPHEDEYDYEPEPEARDRVWCDEHQQWEPVYDEAELEPEPAPAPGPIVADDPPVNDDTPVVGDVPVYDDAPVEDETPVYDDGSDIAGIVVEPPDVLFDPGSSTLSAGARSRLQRFADSVRSRHDLEVVLRGHTDGSSRESDAFTLSEQRAFAVRSFLVEEGVPWRRVRIVGLGETRPVVSDDTAAARQRNRRVEIVIRGVEPG